MADRKRTPIDPPTPRDQISDAIDAVEQRKHQRAAARIPLLTQPHQWPPDARVTITPPADGQTPVMLLWDEGEQAFRPIVLAPGQEWEIRRLEKQRGPQLWTPPAGQPS